MSKPRLHIDLETRSAVDLRKTGVYVYGADRTTDVWCVAYAFDDGPVELWTPEQPCPPAIVEHVKKGGLFRAWNANFERIIWFCVLHFRYGWPLPKLESWRCAMAEALALSLPASLENAAAVIGLTTGKDMIGRGLMLRMARPRKPRQGEDPTKLHWWDDQDRKHRLYEYCKQDVVVEREVSRRLLPLRQSEQQLWFLDQTICDRGVYVDVELCQAALKIVNVAKGWLDDEMCVVTDGAVSACTNVGQLTTWLRDNGCPVESVAKGDIDEALLDRSLTPAVRRALELRREAARAAVSKIEALLNGTNKDGRARGLLQFHAAGPGRWGGRRFQPHNLRRPVMEDKDIDEAIAAVRTGNADYVRMRYGDVLAVVADCLRGMIKAPPGKKIVAADLSNIEGRVTSYVSGEEWKLDAFRAFDNGTGHDLYKLTAGKILGKRPEDINKDERQGYGKVPELALGFQGGVVAFQKMAVNYGVDLTDERADEIKVAWREEHPNTTQTWYDLECAALTAVRERGRIVRCGPVAFRVAGSWLFLQLPSGRCIAYPFPRVEDKPTPWGEMKPTVVFKGVDTFTRKWGDCKAYGGLWMQNIAEGISRDVLAEGMIRLELAGYPIILTVHDEAVAEPKVDVGTPNEFEQIMTTVPVWAPGLPIAAQAWEGERYRK